MDESVFANLDDFLRNEPCLENEPSFLLLGEENAVEEAAKHIAAYCHPFFGRTRLLFVACPTSYAHTKERFALALSMGLLSVEECEINEASVKGSTVVCLGTEIPQIRQYQPKNILVLLPFARNCTDIVLDGPLAEIAEDDPYRDIVSVMSLYGKPLSEFALPKGKTEGPLSRDYHYLWPCHDLLSFDADKDELALSLIQNEGALCPEESHSVIVSALSGEDVDPVKLYAAIRSCYTAPCLLRDMASHIHNGWMLATLAFHPNPESKKDMMAPYPMLLAKVLPALDSLPLEKAFGKDILYSDYLVPLLYLKRLVQSE